MQNTIYDIAFIGGGAAGMFAAINSPKNLKKIILEKTGKLGTKVLLSGGERCNVSNININPEKDYFGRNKKALFSIFKKFSQYDMVDWLEKRGIKTHIEDRGRIILQSGKSQDIVAVLIEELFKNEVEVKTNFSVDDVEKDNEFFCISSGNEHIFSKKVVVSTGGKSFAQVGTDGWGYSLAQKFGVQIVPPYKGLCGIVTREDLKELSGSTVSLNFHIMVNNKLLYTEYGSFLFTHFGVSGPLVYNGVLKIGEYLQSKNMSEGEEIKYIRDYMTIVLKFEQTSLTKKIEKYFHLNEENMEISLHMNDIRGWSEAKVTGGGVLMDELNNSFETKKVSGLYFIGELVDITGKTGGFNLQSAWSQGYVVGKSL